MTLEEAKIIFSGWQEYIEIADKMHQIFSVVPESFLPYPVETLEEALNIIAKDYFDAGNVKMAKNIQRIMAQHLVPYFFSESQVKPTDEEVLEKMLRDLNVILTHQGIKEIYLANLKRCRDSWAKTKKFKSETHGSDPASI